MSHAPLPRLSARRGFADDDDVLFEGVPAHLLTPLREWAHLNLGRRDDPRDTDAVRRACLTRLAITCRVEVGAPQAYLNALVNLIDSDRYGEADDFLDVVDMHLQLFGQGHRTLRQMLSEGGSAWTVAESPLRLERRVPDEEQQLYVTAVTPTDEASVQLQEAWAKVYGRDPDPSDAWDHAIKAVEILLHPIVSPANGKATLGTMLRDLEAKPEKWSLTLATSSTTVGAVEALTGMLRLIWPNPDRHGSGSDSSRVPTQEEAEQVVRLAVFVAGWLRVDALQTVAPATGSP